ncbi:hypothetical protein LUZ63_012339 [Rhynchospora breviuscula]|uniref:Reverse transcriptase zinc-binding domain-containing protein n=1 Tax=Rhynchospora breviuscula TaxID=2022672 RepID=A0A9Q0CKN4_9POAL|nr:hypothetical protein LUZ63_012339 [Rhynchospora breviuscula]
MNGYFSSNSAYKVLADTGIWSYYYKQLWKIKVPPKVKIFLWLLLQDRLLTQDNFQVRGWPTIHSCTTCQSPVTEIAPHLFIHCTFTHRLWDLIQLLFHLPVLTFTDNIIDFWLNNRVNIEKQWDIIWAAVSWALWKERNARVFSSDASNHYLLLREIAAILDLWEHFA